MEFICVENVFYLCMVLLYENISVWKHLFIHVYFHVVIMYAFAHISVIIVSYKRT